MKPTPRRSAFTLVELLAATAVVAILVALLAALASQATLTIATATQRADADKHAAQVFDRMARDFSGLIKGADTNATFSSGPGNNKLFFYSEAPGYFSGDPSASDRSPVSLIGYRINPQFQLERLGKGLTWDGAPSGSQGGAIVFRSYSNGRPAPHPLDNSTLPGHWLKTLGDPPKYDGSDADYHVLGSQVIRLAFCFALKPGGSQTGSYSHWPGLNQRANAPDWNQVSAVIVAIAVMDAKSRNLLAEPEKVGALLPSPTQDDLQAQPPQLMATLWNQSLRTPSFAREAGIAPSLAGAIRIYQRSFPFGPQ